LPFVKGQIPLLYPVADQVADLDTDLHVRDCVSCACRRPVNSWSKASCEPVCDQVRAISPLVTLSV